MLWFEEGLTNASLQNLFPENIFPIFFTNAPLYLSSSHSALTNIFNDNIFFNDLCRLEWNNVASLCWKVSYLSQQCLEDEMETECEFQKGEH